MGSKVVRKCAKKFFQYIRVKRRRVSITHLLLFPAIGMQPLAVYAKEQRIQNVIGYGEDENLAIRQALRDAVARACGERLSSALDLSSLSNKTKTLSNDGRDDRNFSSSNEVSSNISTTTDGIVSRYDVIRSERDEAGNRHVVAVNVVVGRCLVERDTKAPAPKDYSAELRQINSTLAALGDRQVEKRSKIVNVVAYIDIPPELLGQRSESQTDQLRRLAIETGKSLAVTQVKTSLGSNSSMKVDDKFGLPNISVLSSRDLPEWGDKYSVQLEVEVELFPKEGSAAPVGMLAPLSISVRTDKITYREGEEVFLYVRGNKDFYGRITYEDASGAIIQVLPNLFRSDALFKGGVVYRVPGEDDRFRLRISPPFGRERFTVYASTGKLGEISVKAVDSASGLRFSSDDRTMLARKTRGLSVEQATGPLRVATVPSPVSSLSNLDFFEATWEISTNSGR
jgi:hypothetical protein